MADMLRGRRTDMLGGREGPKHYAIPEYHLLYNPPIYTSIFSSLSRKQLS